MEKRRILNYTLAGIILYFAIQLASYASNNPLYPIKFYDLMDEMIGSFGWFILIIPLISMMGYTQYLFFDNNIGKSCYFKIPFYPLLLSLILFIPSYVWFYFNCNGESCIGIAVLLLIYIVYLLFFVLVSFLLAFLLNISQKSQKIARLIENLDKVIIYISCLTFFISLFYSFLWATEWWKYLRFLGLNLK